jgi:hypothetical protein
MTLIDARTRVVLVSVACVLLGASAAAAQDPEAATPVGVGVVAAVDAPPARPPHPFWDRTNIVLFGGVAASRALDFTSTSHFRALGDREWLLTNRIVDDKPLFATIEAASVAVSIGVSYILHRTNHHTLERWVSVVHLGVTAGGAAHNYSLKAPAS